MKKFTNILSYVVVIALGIGFFYGMAHAQNQFGGVSPTLQGIGVAGADSATA